MRSRKRLLRRFLPDRRKWKGCSQIRPSMPTEQEPRSFSRNFIRSRNVPKRNWRNLGNWRRGLPNLRAEERPFLLTEESSSIRTCLSVARRSGMVRERVGTFACCLYVGDGVSERSVASSQGPSCRKAGKRGFSGHENGRTIRAAGNDKKSDCHHIASVVCHAGGRCSENGAALLFFFWKFFLEKETIGMDTNVGRQAVSLFVRRAS